MARPTKTSFWAELAEFKVYKRNQGRLTRQLTAIAVALTVFFGAWILSRGPLGGIDSPMIRLGIPLGISAVGAWIAFRLVNWPRFADFLIAVEAEMDKVSWASREELYRATVVVLGTMFFLAFVLLVYDLFWVWFFQLLGILQPTGESLGAGG